MVLRPRLEAREHEGVHVLADPGAARRGVTVAFGDRRGGVSPPPFDTLNLAARVGDDPAHVERNRARVATAVGFAARELALARQVHGAELLEVPAGRRGVLGEADGLVARASGPVLAILTADCAPVAVWGSAGLALAHAGWRGLVAGVVARAAAAVGLPRAAWVGPAIRSCCYRVGPEVVSAFRGAGLPVAGPDRVDPGDAARAALARAGVDAIAVADVCTACSSHYFSYRRDGTTGRQGAFAALASRA